MQVASNTAVETTIQAVRSRQLVPEADLARWLERNRHQLESIVAANLPGPDGTRANSATLDLLQRYDAIVIAFSGGKDSLAATLHVLDLLNGDRSRLELWHHLVDGEDGDLWDWPCTRAYCEAVANTLEIPLYCSWREGGLEREMLRDGTPTAAIVTELPNGERATTGGKGPPGTRHRFPQLSADLSVRYCSSYIKIDVGAAAIRMRWPEGKVLLVTGERREESASRATYARVERHKSTASGRRVDQWRPVLDWSEAQVWQRIRAAGIVPHPAYELAYGRLSCACCIFGGPSEWATFKRLRPQQWHRMVSLEATFDRTLRRGETLEETTARGVPFAAASDVSLVEKVTSPAFVGPIRVAPSEWKQPAGAFRHGAGPV